MKPNTKAIIKAEELALGNKVSLTPTGLIIASGMTYKDWAHIGTSLREMARCLPWWVGDWAIWGEENLPEEFSQEFDPTKGYDMHTITNYMLVCRNIDQARRRAELSFDHHNSVYKFEPKDQDKFLDVAVKDDLRSQEFRQYIKDHKHKQRAQEFDKLVIKDNMVDLRFGDFRKVLKDLEPNSIDLILTDPPYMEEFLPLWKDLSELAYRVLKPGRFCVAYSGQMHLPEVYKSMSTFLEYYWTMCIYLEGKTQIVNGVNMICRWKPILIYQKRPCHKLERTIQDYIISEAREKGDHEWQQSESGVSKLVELFSEPGNTILDPFAGAGTTLVCGRKLKRRVMAAEIDKVAYNLAKGRLDGKI